jgi:GxxExxY protein
MQIKHNDLTERIIGIFFKVYNKLGYGFLEKIYENALMIELRSERIQAMAQSPVRVEYNGQTVGEYFADLMIEDKIIVEIKAAKSLTVEHEAQLLNYLKATDIEVGLLLNFGPKPQIKRKLFDNSRK